MNEYFPNVSYLRFTPKLWLKQFLQDLPNASKIEDEELEMLEHEYLQGYLTETEKAFSNLTPLGMVVEKDDQVDDEDYEQDNNDYDDVVDEDDMDNMEMDEDHDNNEEGDNSFQVSVVSTSSESEEEDGEEDNTSSPLATFFRQRMEISAPVNLIAEMVMDESMIIMVSDSDTDDEESPGV